MYSRLYPRHFLRERLPQLKFQNPHVKFERAVNSGKLANITIERSERSCIDHYNLADARPLRLWSSVDDRDQRDAIRRSAPGPAQGR